MDETCIMVLSWKKSAGLWQRRGHVPISADEFQIGVTQPMWRGSAAANNNVGCLPGVSRTTVASVTQANGAVHSNLTITGKINISASNQKFYNCRFTYSSDGAYTGGLAQNSSNNDYPVMFERCEFEPTTPWDRYNGWYGHHATLLRCAITKTVDALGFYNPSGGPVAMQLLGCWAGYLSWYDDDYYVDPDGTSFPSGRSNGHSDGSGTHNDGVQHGGGSTMEVRGCFFQGAKYNALNPTNVTLDSNYINYTVATGNGVTPLDEDTGTYGFPQAGNGILAKADVYAPVNNLTIVDNWFWNWGHGVSLQTGGSQGATPLVATITGNRFGGRWRDYGGTHRYYPIRYNTNCIVNGYQPGAAGSMPDTWGNTWSNDVHASMIISGSSVASQPVRHRYDA